MEILANENLVCQKLLPLQFPGPPLPCRGRHPGQWGRESAEKHCLMGIILLFVVGSPSSHSNTENERQCPLALITSDLFVYLGVFSLAGTLQTSVGGH